MKLQSFWFSLISFFMVVSVQPASATPSFPEWKVCTVPDSVCEIIDLSEIVPEDFNPRNFGGTSWPEVLDSVQGMSVQFYFEQYALEAYILKIERVRGILDVPAYTYSLDPNARRMEIRHQE